VGGVSASLRQNSQEARIQLEPPELGKLKIALVLEGGRVHARIIAESAEVGALIQNHLPELKQALQSHSLELDTVRVDVNSGGGEQGDFSRGFQQDLGARGGRGGPNAFSQWAEKDAEESGSSTRSGSHGSVSVWA
jgi:flagellar hook-length control protein FliK